MQGQETLFSHKSDLWETPYDFYTMLDNEFGFTLDPCASESNTKCKKYYTPETDGLAQSWENEIVFINPPYSQVTKWVEKSYVETVVAGATCVLLVPARTDTKWFHNYVYHVPEAEIRFIKGRIRFLIDGEPIRNKKGQIQPAPFPSMVVIFRQQT